ncbi:hypothetical protein BSF37_22080 [Serratia marcescens]|nr:hypothetical protein [Serratia marcescens]
MEQDFGSVSPFFWVLVVRVLSVFVVAVMQRTATVFTGIKSAFQRQFVDVPTNTGFDSTLETAVDR